MDPYEPLWTLFPGGESRRGSDSGHGASVYEIGEAEEGSGRVAEGDFAFEVAALGIVDRTVQRRPEGLGGRAMAS